MRHILFEDERRDDFLPLSFTRPVWDLRIGIDSLREKWARAFPDSGIEALALPYLRPRFNQISNEGEATWINCRYLPDEELLRAIAALAPQEGLFDTNGSLIAGRFDYEWQSADSPLSAGGEAAQSLRKVEYDHSKGLVIEGLPCLFRKNKACIERDFAHYASEPGQALNDPHTAAYGKDNIYLAPGAKVRAAILNAEDGPIYIGPEASISEGAIVLGAHSIGPHSTVQPGAKLRGDSSFGPWVKVGGEVGNSLIQGYSNKGHEGYMGNSVLGHWCNIGADSNTSNLKNNYAEVKLWNYPAGKFKPTGTQFCGLIMGDHSKCGINTMFNTGTVVGVFANIFGAGFPRNYIPSFSWGGAQGVTEYRYDKAMEVAEAVMARRGVELDQIERDILQHIYEDTTSFRKKS